MSRRESAGSTIPPEDVVEFLRVDLNPPSACVAAYRSLLSPDEQDRADRFVTDALTRRSVVTRGVLRQVLSQRLKISAADLRLAIGPQGKPELADDHPASWRFNVSHSGDLAVIAVAWQRVVGVDVEAIDRRVSRDDLAARFFSQRECECYFSLTEPQRLAAFYRIWTCKEAYLKATGSGLSFPLGKFSVRVSPDEPPGLVDVADLPGESHRWSFVAPDVGPDHVAALAVEGHGWTLKTGLWDHGAEAAAPSR